MNFLSGRKLWAAKVGNIFWDQTLNKLKALDFLSLPISLTTTIAETITRVLQLPQNWITRALELIAREVKEQHSVGEN